MTFNDKFIQLKDSINSLKQELASNVTSKGVNVSETNKLSEIINRVNDIKYRWFNGLKFSTSISDSELEKILSEFDFSNVTDLSDLLRDRKNITTFPSFDTSKATNLNNLFRNCTRLVSLPYFDVSNAESIEGMIEGCTSLQDVGGFGGLKADFKFVMNSNLTHDSLLNIFNNLANVDGKQLAIGQTNRDRLTDEEIAIATQKGWNVAVKLPYVSGLFSPGSTITDAMLENIFQGYDTANVTSLKYFFNGCSKITTIPLIDSSNVTTLVGTFQSCSSLTSIPLIDSSNVTTMYSCFYGCSSLKSIPLINTSKVNNIESLFNGCSSLTSIPLIDLSNVTTIHFTFSGCSSLISIPLINAANINRMSAAFQSCKALRYLLLKNLGTQPTISDFMGKIQDTKWGVEDESIPESIGARQSMIDSMITYSFDRASAGYSALTYSLSSASKSVLTEEEIAAVTAKGYTIA